MDPFAPPTASHEIAQRINVLERRVTVYHPEKVGDAEHALRIAREDKAHDEALLAQWQDIAKRSS